MVEFHKTFVDNLKRYNPSFKELVEKLKNMTLPILWVVKHGTFKDYENHKLDEGVPMGQHKVKHLSLDEKLLKQFEEHVIQEVKFD